MRLKSLIAAVTMIAMASSAFAQSGWIVYNMTGRGQGAVPNTGSRYQMAWRGYLMYLEWTGELGNAEQGYPYQAGVWMMVVKDKRARAMVNVTPSVNWGDVDDDTGPQPQSPLNMEMSNMTNKRTGYGMIWMGGGEDQNGWIYDDSGDYTWYDTVAMYAYGRLRRNRTTLAMNPSRMTGGMSTCVHYGADAIDPDDNVYWYGQGLQGRMSFRYNARETGAMNQSMTAKYGAISEDTVEEGWSNTYNAQSVLAETTGKGRWSTM